VNHYGWVHTAVCGDHTLLSLVSSTFHPILGASNDFFLKGFVLEQGELMMMIIQTQDFWT